MNEVIILKESVAVSTVKGEMLFGAGLIVWCLIVLFSLLKFKSKESSKSLNVFFTCLFIATAYFPCAFFSDFKTDFLDLFETEIHYSVSVSEKTDMDEFYAYYKILDVKNNVYTVVKKSTC